MGGSVDHDLGKGLWYEIWDAQTSTSIRREPHLPCNKTSRDEHTREEDVVQRFLYNGTVTQMEMLTELGHLGGGHRNTRPHIDDTGDEAVPHRGSQAVHDVSRSLLNDNDLQKHDI